MPVIRARMSKLVEKTEQGISLHSSEAIVRRCSVKKMFLIISQNSQKNTCAKVSFLIKLQEEEETKSAMKYLNCTLNLLKVNHENIELMLFDSLWFLCGFK